MFGLGLSGLGVLELVRVWGGLGLIGLKDFLEFWAWGFRISAFGFRVLGLVWGFCVGLGLEG